MLVTDLYRLADQHYARKRELTERFHAAQARGLDLRWYSREISSEGSIGDAYYHAAELAQAASRSLVADIDRGADNAATPATAAHLRIAAEHALTCLR